MCLERCRASAEALWCVIEHRRVDLRLGTLAVGRPLRRLEMPYLYQRRSLGKVKWWKKRRQTVNNSDGGMTMTTRNVARVKRQLACYQRATRCWSPIRLKEGPSRQDSPTWPSALAGSMARGVWDFVGEIESVAGRDAIKEWRQSAAEEVYERSISIDEGSCLVTRASQYSQLAVIGRTKTWE